MGICVSSHATGGVETAPVPSVNDLQKQLGVSREEAYQQKLDLQSPNFVKRFSESGMSLASKGSLPRICSWTNSPTSTLDFENSSRQMHNRSPSFDKTQVRTSSSVTGRAGNS